MTFKQWQRNNSFRTQLISTIAGCALLLTAITAFAVPWLVSRAIYSFMETHWSDLAAEFAAKAELVLLVGSTNRAKTIVDGFATYPHVKAVALYNHAGKAIATSGHSTEFDRTYTHRATQRDGTIDISDAKHHWLYRVKVTNRRRATPKALSQQASPPVNRTLGYLEVVVSNQPITHLVTELSSTNGLMVMMIAGATCVLLLYFTHKLTQPLRKFAGTMRQAQSGQKNLRAELDGSQDIVLMERAFNGLMAKIDQHAETLESEVKLRTLELSQARDVALSATKTRSRFFALFSHEMRTPLNAMIGFTELVRKELELKPEQHVQSLRFLDRSLTAASNLETQIDKVLTIARIEAGKMPIDVQPVRPSDIVRQVVNVIDPIAKQANNEVSVNGVIDATIWTDQEKLAQIVMNLLSNAVKFTQQGCVSVETVAADDRLTLTVTDTGCGIAADQLTQIFEPYHQAPNNDTSGPRGTGLGLAITRSFVELLGGTIDVKSTVNQGTSFTVTLPSMQNATTPISQTN